MTGRELAALLMQRPDHEVMVQAGEDNENACPVGRVAASDTHIIVSYYEGDSIFLPEIELDDLTS